MDGQLSIWNEQKAPVVVMHNYFITAQFSNLELNEMRILLLMIAKLDRDADDFVPTRLLIQDIVPKFGGKDVKLIIKACDELMNKMTDVRILAQEQGKNVYERMRVIDYVRYVEGTNFIEANFGQRIRSYLLQLKGNFTIAELKELLKLKSSYAIRLFLVVKSLYRVGQTYDTSFIELKKMICGSEDVYPEYKIFKRDVLKTAQKMLENTSAAFSIQEFRSGRNINRLIISPVNSPKTITSQEIEILLSEKLLIRIKELPLNKTGIARILDILNTHMDGILIDEVYISFLVLKIEEYKKKGKLKSPGGVLLNVLYNGDYLSEYREYINKKNTQTTTINTNSLIKPIPEIKKISYTDLSEMHKIHLRKNKDVINDFNKYVEVIFLSEGFEWRNINDEWFIIK